MHGRLEVADIFRSHGPSYRATHPLPLQQLKTMRAVEICRTAELGGHVDECEDCGHVKISYNSCRNRHCPKCQFLKKEQWIEARERELLPIAYFHVVFTLPEELNAVALRNREVLYNLLDAHGTRTRASRRPDRLHCRAPHVGAEPPRASPPPLHRLGWRVIRGQMGFFKEEVPLPREGSLPALQGKISLLSQKDL